MTGRIVIEDLHPRTTTGCFPAKAVVGEAVPVTAAIYGWLLFGEPPGEDLSSPPPALGARGQVAGTPS